MDEELSFFCNFAGELNKIYKNNSTLFLHLEIYTAFIFQFNLGNCSKKSRKL